MAQRIEDYGLIGDTHTAALVGRDGSIDWCCVPRFDSDACFAKLLGDERHGYWRIAPAGADGTDGGTCARRAYRGDTLVLESEFATAEGAFRVIDCMPVRDERPELVRVVEGIRGRPKVRMELAMAFGYGSVTPWVRREGGAVVGTSGPDAVMVSGPVGLCEEGRAAVGEFAIPAGQRAGFHLAWFPSHETPPRPADPVRLVGTCERWWAEWAGRCRYDGPWRDAVVRSLLTLKALTYGPTGGIVAAATTSLPETLGGGRNWDYRYCWLRDASFTLEALMRGGYREEAGAWRDWLLRSVGGDPSEMQTVYGPAGERRLAEWEAGWLPGYEGAGPVRVGNDAAGQFQLDVYGEVMSALYEARRRGLVESEPSWDLQRGLVASLEDAWQRPDDGIWEVRGPRRHFTHSKVMAWVGADRAVRMAEELGLAGPVERWRALAGEIHREVCERGYDRGVGAFTQSYGNTALDAAALLVPLVGFLPAGDPRVASTVAAVEAGLCQDGLVARYATGDGAGTDGLAGHEGSFLACSFWLVECLWMTGEKLRARALFERLVGLRNDLGLLAEEYDLERRRQVGNFPQALSHVSLINAAYRLGRDRGEERPAGGGAQRRAGQPKLGQPKLGQPKRGQPRFDNSGEAGKTRR